MRKLELQKIRQFLHHVTPSLAEFGPPQIRLAQVLVKVVMPQASYVVTLHLTIVVIELENRFQCVSAIFPFKKKHLNELPENLWFFISSFMSISVACSLCLSVNSSLNSFLLPKTSFYNFVEFSMAKIYSKLNISCTLGLKITKLYSIKSYSLRAFQQYQKHAPI